MLVPPKDMRSRRLLEKAIRQSGIPEPQGHNRIAAETYETVTSIMRMRNEARRGARDTRVVVVPSDVALAYKPGKEFGGLNADKFKWVPIYHVDGREAHPLTMEVCVTRKKQGKTAGPDMARIIEALQQAVRLLNENGDVGLSGKFRSPDRGRAPQRRRPIAVETPRGRLDLADKPAPESSISSGNSRGRR
jgi:hypothetical protein